MLRRIMHSVTNAAVVRLSYRPPTGHGRLVSNQHQNIMKTTKYVLASSAATLALLVAAPVLADSDNRGPSLGGNHDIGLGAVVRLFAKDDDHRGIGESVRELAKQQRDRHNDDDDNDGDRGERGQHAFLNAIGAAGAGVVTSVSGSTFTINPIGAQTTTTVTTNASTTYLLNGQATTSNALSVGSKVFVSGTTTSDTSITASIVSIWNDGISFLRHLIFRQ